MVRLESSLVLCFPLFYILEVYNRWILLDVQPEKCTAGPRDSSLSVLIKACDKDSLLEIATMRGRTSLSPMAKETHSSRPRTTIQKSKYASYQSLKAASELT